MHSLSVNKEKGRFLRIVCPRCYNQQIVFGKSALVVKCIKCNKRLTDTTGGKTRLKAQVKKIYG